MKLCKDCNYHKSHDYYGTGSGASDECLCPDFKGEINPVTGKDKENTCFIMRIYEEKCGKEGKYWMEKQPPETKTSFWDRMFNFREL
jgi:hypothetical protein